MNKIYGVKTPTKKQLKLLEEQRKNWIEIAKKNDSSYDKTEPFYIQIWLWIAFFSSFSALLKRYVSVM